MAEWRCEIQGEPVAKGRPRVAVVNGRARAYTPSRTRAWEADAARDMKQAWGKRDPIDVACEVTVFARFERPAKLRTRKRAAEHAFHVSRPDGDNILKAACDALEKGGVLTNDSRAAWCSVEKRYCFADEVPHVLVVVTWEE